MTAKPPVSSSLEDEEHPVDLFDVLETLPMPASPGEPLAGDGAGTDPPVGYASPPVRSRWKKGGASPNPRGRPPKQVKGPLTNMMAQEIDTQVDGVQMKLTKRAVLDRILRDKAIKDGGPWLRLWDQCQARDEHLRVRVELYRQRKDNKIARTGQRLRADIAFRDTLFRWVERCFPGVVDVERRLLERGAIQRGANGLGLTGEAHAGYAEMSHHPDSQGPD